MLLIKIIAVVSLITATIMTVLESFIFATLLKRHKKHRTIYKITNCILSFVFLILSLICTVYSQYNYGG